MHLYFIVKLIHILSSTILFGTGKGIAFFMFRSWFVSDVHAKYYAASNTVLGDFLFTTPAVLIQPITGIWLIINTGYPWNAPWLLASYFLYCLVGCFWLPVVYIQIRLKRIAAECLKEGTELPAVYQKLFKIWFYMGFPAFFSVIAIFYLMIAKPS